MDKLKTGGDNASDLVSTALPHQKLDTLLIPQQVRRFSIELKKRMLKLNVTSDKFVIAVESTKQSQVRMLTPIEIEDLRKTKRKVADRIFGLLKQI